MPGLFEWFFKRTRPESQGPTPEELREAEENGEAWDDRIGFYSLSERSIDVDEKDAESEPASSAPSQAVDPDTCDHDWEYHVGNPDGYQACKKCGKVQ